MKNYLLILGIISVFLVVACAQQPASTPTPPPPAVVTPIPPVDVTPVQDASETAEIPGIVDDPVPPPPPASGQPAEVSDSDVVEIDIVAKQWDFNPATIIVSEGDEVKLNIKSVDVTHGFSLFEFGVNERLTPGRTTTVQFTADRAGEYTFLCTVPCGRGHSGMNGKLIVE